MLCKYPLPGNWVGGGVATHISSLLHAFETNECRSDLFYVFSFGDREETLRFPRVNVQILKSHWYYYVVPLLALLKLAVEIHKNQPDIIHVQGSNVSPYSLVALLIPFQCKKIVTIHNFYYLEKVAQGQIRRHSFAFNLLYFFERWLIHKMDHIITVSTKVKNNLLSHFNIRAQDITVIYNGVDSNVFNPCVDGSRVRTELGVQRNETLILYAKDLERYNGPHVLLASIPHIVKKYPNIKIVIAGEGTMRDQLVKAATKSDILDVVKFTGRVPYQRMKYYIAAADVIVIPSITISGHEEGTSSLMLEAMALEKPVIASAVGGLKEVISNHSTGILVPDHNPIALAKAILYIIHDPQIPKLIGKQAREFITNEMTWNQVADKTLNIYETVVAS